jgi:HEAT repeat protein
MSTGEGTAESLVDQLAAAGDWPRPELCAAIVAKGSDAVAPLRALLQREPSDESGRGVAVVAGWLLGDIGDPSAVPDLLKLLRYRGVRDGDSAGRQRPAQASQNRRGDA